MQRYLHTRLCVKCYFFPRIIYLVCAGEGVRGVKEHGGREGREEEKGIERQT